MNAAQIAGCVFLGVFAAGSIVNVIMEDGWRQVPRAVGSAVMLLTGLAVIAAVGLLVIWQAGLNPNGDWY